MANTVSNVSSMLRSANSLYNKQIAYNDDLASYEWQNSQQTVDDYNKYVAYIKGQQTKTSDPTKQLTYQKTVDSAFQSFTSNEIQRSAISVLEGGSTLSDKQTTVGQLYEQAVNNGDLNLATNLRQQYDQIDTEIQRQTVAAQTAATTLATANSNAQGLDYKDSGAELEKGLADLTAEYKQGGPQAFNKALKTFVDQNSAAFTALGVKIPKGSTTSIAEVTSGVIHAIGQYNILAAQATQVSDPSASAKYYQDAIDISTGAKSFSSPYGTHSMGFYQDVAANPNMYVSAQADDGSYTLKKSTIGGYQVVNGNIMEVPANGGTTAINGVLNSNPNSKGNITSLSTKDQQAALQKLGFTVLGTTSNGQIKVQLSGGDVKDAKGKTVTIPGSNSWLPASKVNANKNAEINLVPTDKGFQFTSTDANGTKHLYTIATDAKGLSGVVETNAKGQTVGVHGQYGFNNQQNTATAGSTVAVQAAHQKAVQTAIQKTQQQNAQNLISGKPLTGGPTPVLSVGPQAKSAPLPLLKPTPAPAKYVAPSSIKPGTKLTAQEQAQAQQAINQLLGTKNGTIINNSITAISKSAGYGNPYDAYKLTLLTNNPQTSQYTVKTGQF